MASASTSPTLTLQTRTTSRPHTSSASQLVCTWEGHCLGDSCSNENDCDNDWVCANKTCITCCITDPTPTFRSTQFPSADASTTTDSLLSQTSATLSPSSRAVITPTSTADQSSEGLSAGAAAGIGVGCGAALIVCVVGGFFFLKRRRKAKQNDVHELGAVPATDHDDDRKELYRHEDRQELATRHPPVELSAIEVAELQDSDIGRPREEVKPAT